MIAEAYRPDAEEMAAARRVLAAFASATAEGRSAVASAGSDFVDLAVARRAERLIVEADPAPGRPV